MCEHAIFQAFPFLKNLFARFFHMLSRRNISTPWNVKWWGINNIRNIKCVSYFSSSSTAFTRLFSGADGEYIERLLSYFLVHHLLSIFCFMGIVRQWCLAAYRIFHIMNFPTKLRESFLCFLISSHSTNSTYYGFDSVLEGKQRNSFCFCIVSNMPKRVFYSPG